MRATLRAFIALPLPAAVRAELARVNQLLAAQLPPRSVRFVAPERMHLTLRFLGDTEQTRLPDIAAVMEQVFAAQPGFSLKLSNLGSFPGGRRPRVLWAGLTGDVDRLGASKRRLDDGLTPLGWLPETKPFRPHLTLGRVKDGRAVSQSGWQATAAAVDFTVSEVTLFESILKRDGPIYRVRHKTKSSG